MKPDVDLSERQRLRRGIVFHRVLNIVLVACLFVSLLLSVWVVVRDPTKIVPPVVQRPYELGPGYASRDYLIDMAYYVLGTVLTVTPQNADHNAKIILKITDPDGYPELKTSLDAATQRIRQEQITTIWVPRKEEVSEAGRWVRVSGSLQTYIADKLTTSREKTYHVDFTITSAGRLYVKSIYEVVRDDSRKSAG